MDNLIRYEDGLRVIVTPVAAFRSVAVGFWVGTGSADEDSRNNGISHFIEHNIFKGTDKMCAFDIAREFDKVGAAVNAFTSKESTCYYFKSIDTAAEHCFEVMSNIFFDSAFLKEELDRERKVIIEEINMVEDSPEDICSDLIAEIMYGKASLGKTILGPAENVKRFGKEDIRAYMNRFYCPENLVISFAGNITYERADELVRKYVLPRLKCSGFKRKDKTPHSFKGGYGERIKDFEQSTLAIAYPSVSSEDKFNAVQLVMNVILGGGMSSRLFQRIREQLGLAYSVYTIPSAYSYSGFFGIYLNVATENAVSALKATKEELEKFVSEGITDAELDLAKAQLISASVFAQENLQSIMIATGKKLVLTDKIYDLDKQIEQFSAVTRGDVTDFAKKIFTSEKVGLAYVGKQINASLYEIIK